MAQETTRQLRLLGAADGAHLQREGQGQVGLHLSTGGQHDLVGTQDALGALGRRTVSRSRGRRQVAAVGRPHLSALHTQEERLLAQGAPAPQGEAGTFVERPRGAHILRAAGPAPDVRLRTESRGGDGHCGIGDVQWQAPGDGTPLGSAVRSRPGVPGHPTGCQRRKRGDQRTSAETHALTGTNKLGVPEPRVGRGRHHLIAGLTPKRTPRDRKCASLPFHTGPSHSGTLCQCRRPGWTPGPHARGPQEGSHSEPRWLQGPGRGGAGRLGAGWLPWPVTKTRGRDAGGSRTKPEP